MTDELELVLFALCIIPMLMFGVALFACELRIQYRDNDTRRYPRYGRSDDMRDSEFRVKSKLEDNET